MLFFPFNASFYDLHRHRNRGRRSHRHRRRVGVMAASERQSRHDGRVSRDQAETSTFRQQEGQREPRRRNDMIKHFRVNLP